MAVYEYRCRTCDDVFEMRRPMSEADEPARCANGHDDSVRLLSVFASVGTATSPGATTSAPAGPCGGACACYPG